MHIGVCVAKGRPWLMIFTTCFERLISWKRECCSVGVGHALNALDSSLFTVQQTMDTNNAALDSPLFQCFMRLFCFVFQKL